MSLSNNPSSQSLSSPMVGVNEELTNNPSSSSLSPFPSSAINNNNNTNPNNPSSSSSASAAAAAVAASQSIDEEKYQIRPSYKNMFKPRSVQSILRQALMDSLSNKVYDQNETGNWTKEIAANIKNKLKELKLPRYKYLVQVFIGEMKGAGVRVGCRCLWDSQTDKVAQETYQNESLFAVAVAFGIYLY